MRAETGHASSHDRQEHAIANSTPRAGAGKRRAWWLWPALLAIAALAALALRPSGTEPARDASAAQFSDIRGRPVTIDQPSTRIAIDDSRYLVALGLIHPDPVALLAAWPRDINRLGDETYRQLLASSPELADLPRIASSAGDFNAEAMLAAAPEVALLSLESGVTDAQIAQLEGAGIKVVVVDFFVTPFENLEPSLRLLGALTGRERQAEDFIAFRAARMSRIADGVAALSLGDDPSGAGAGTANDRPTVFLEPHAGMSADCCNSPGRGNIGDYLSFVGGHNIGADVISQSFGKLNLEYVIARDPAVYIATGGPHLADSGGLVLGAGVSAGEAARSLARVSQRRGIAGLTAVAEGRTHGISHQLINSPLDIVAIEAFARWVHPATFTDVDPAATLDEINSRFLAVPYEGIYWVDLP